MCGRTARVREGGGAVLVASLPEAGLSRALPWKPERIAKGADLLPRVIIPEKNCVL